MIRSELKLLIVILVLLFVLSGCSVKEKSTGSEIEHSTEEISVSSESASADSETTELSISENIYSETVTPAKNIQQTPVTNVSVVGNKKDDSFTVIFKNHDGTVLKTEKVKKGGSATAPSIPAKDGCKFVKWNIDYTNVQTNIIVTAVFEKINLPTLVTANVSAKPGDKIKVPISALNNPGLLAMLVNIQYDESALTLTKISNGSALSEYMFTPPKNRKSGCNAAWNINDIPEGEQDGEILILYFKVSDNAVKGTYSVSVSCLNNAFDNEYNSLSFDTISGSVTID